MVTLKTANLSYKSPLAKPNLPYIELMTILSTKANKLWSIPSISPVACFAVILVSLSQVTSLTNTLCIKCSGAIL